MLANRFGRPLGALAGSPRRPEACQFIADVRSRGLERVGAADAACSEHMLAGAACQLADLADRSALAQRAVANFARREAILA